MMPPPMSFSRWTTARCPTATFVWTCAAVVGIAFFLPWVHLDAREPTLFKNISISMRNSMKRSLGKNTRSGTWNSSTPRGTASVPTHISGFEIPELANRENTKAIMQLVETFTTNRQQVGLKSYAVYLVPLLAFLCAGLLTRFGGRSRLAAIGVAVICTAVVGSGGWGWLQTRTKELVGVKFGLGLWLSLAAYAGLACAALLRIRLVPTCPPATESSDSSSN